MAFNRNMVIRGGADFSAITKQAQKASKSMRGMQNSVSRSCNAMTSALTGLRRAFAAVGIAVSAAALIGAAREAAEAYDAQAEAEMKLATAMRNTMGARNSEIQSVLDLCSAQQKLGIVGDEVQLAGAQELSTYLSLSSSLKKLIPVMNDMVAQQYGYSASAENAANIATMMGKVMQGQTGALKRLGYAFDEGQEKILKYGSEEQRAAVLADVIKQSVGGMNRALASTPTGRMIQLRNVMGDIKEKFGQVVRTVGVLLLPLLYRVCDILEAIANWANRAANSIAKVFGNTAALVGWKKITTGIVPVVEEGEDLSSVFDDAGESAEKAKRSILGFDKLNILNGNNGTGSSGGGSGGGTGGVGTGSGTDLSENILLDDLDEDLEGLGGRFEKILQGIKDHMGLIKDAALAVGAGLLTWKIGKGLGMQLKSILSAVTTVSGAVLLGLGTWRAWAEGVTFDTLKEQLAGTALMATGLAMAFGKVGGAIGALVGGGVMLVTGILDWIKTGELSTQTFWTMEGGIAAVGVGLTMLIGPWGAVVAAVAGGALAIYHYWDEIKAKFGELGASLQEVGARISEGFTEFFAGVGIIWSQMMALAQQVFETIRNVIVTSAQAAWTFLTTAWTAIQATTISVFTAVKTTITTAITTAKTTMIAAVTSAKASVVSQWNALLASCKSIFQSVRATVMTCVQQAASYLASQSWYGYGVQLMQGFWNGLRSLMSAIWQSVCDFVRRCADAVRSALRIGSPSKVFEEIGEFTGQGFIIGLEGQQEGAESAAEGLAAKPMSAAADAVTGLRGRLAELLPDVHDAVASLSGVGPALADATAAYGSLGSGLSGSAEAGYASNEETFGAMLQVLFSIDSAIRNLELAGDVDCDGDKLFQIIINQNNRAINRTGTSPLRV